MSNENNTTNHVNTLVASFQTSFTANLEQQREFEVRGYRALYTQVAEAFAIAQTILKPENKSEYEAALKERGIDLPKGKSNPYLPVIKLLYGSWADEQKTIFEPNRSAEKYACVFRYLNKRKGKIAQKDIVGHIEEYSDATYGTALKGIEAQDRAEHRTTGSRADNSEALIAGSDLDGSIAIDRPAFVQENQTIGQLWFKLGKDGKVYILGARPLEEKTFDALAIKRGKDILEADAQRSKEERLARAKAA